MIPFNRVPYIGTEQEYIKKAIENRKLCGNGEFTKLCGSWFETEFGTSKALLTTSCTHATEMAVMLSDICAGDEVIMPSFTFVSTANAVVLRGGTPVFVDIRPDTMNIDEKKIEDAITKKTKAIIPVHYAGIPCEMDTIMEIANRYKLKVIEDAAQGIMSKYKGRYLGTIGDYGCISFHETKNISMGEGGALFIRNENNIERAEIIREKGTNRSKFFRGEIEKYTWIDVGSSYLPSELNAAYLWGQLQAAECITADRMRSWKLYEAGLKRLQERGVIGLPYVPDECEHNAHIFYIKCKDIDERTRLIAHMKENKISTVFHYIPLHSSSAGKRYGRFHDTDIYTTIESERLLRLPLYYGITDEIIEKVIYNIEGFYENE